MSKDKARGGLPEDSDELDLGAGDKNVLPEMGANPLFENSPPPDYEYLVDLFRDPEAFKRVFGVDPNEIKNPYAAEVAAELERFIKPRPAPLGAINPTWDEGKLRRDEIIFKILRKDKSNLIDKKGVPSPDNLLVLLEKHGPDLLRSATNTGVDRALQRPEQDQELAEMEAFWRKMKRDRQQELDAIFPLNRDPDAELILDRYGLRGTKHLIRYDFNEIPPRGGYQFKKIPPIYKGKPEEKLEKLPKGDGSSLGRSLDLSEIIPIWGSGEADEGKNALAKLLSKLENTKKKKEK